MRNTATLGGNVAHALPAADGMIALCALDAQAEVASLAGLRRAPDRQTCSSGRGVRPGCASEICWSVFTCRSRQPGPGLGLRAGDAPAGCGAADLEYGGLAAAPRSDDRGYPPGCWPVGPGAAARWRAEAGLARLRIRPAERWTAPCKRCWTSVRFRTSPQRASAEYRQQLLERAHYWNE